MSLSTKRHPHFIDRPLEQWTLPELEDRQARARKPSPKIQLVIDALKDGEVDQVSLLPPAVVDRLHKETTGEFASIDAVLRGIAGSA